MKLFLRPRPEAVLTLMALPGLQALVIVYAVVLLRLTLKKLF